MDCRPHSRKSGAPLLLNGFKKFAKWDQRRGRSTLSFLSRATVKMEVKMNLRISLLFFMRFELFVVDFRGLYKGLFFGIAEMEDVLPLSVSRRNFKMKSVVLLFTFVLVTPLIIHADKDYSCTHVNATFGAPVGSKSTHLIGFLTTRLHRIVRIYCAFGCMWRNWVESYRFDRSDY